MDESRRRFLKLAGGATLALAAGKGAVAASAQSHGTNMHGGRDQGRSGVRYALAIDIKALDEQTQRRMAAVCHKIHNVPNWPKADPTKKADEVKWIWSTGYHNAFPEQAHDWAPSWLHKDVLVLCNHCDNPPCVRACPTQATFQRADGIVAMDYHRCIGCRFCVSACPYGARSLNFWDPRVALGDNIDPDFPTRTKGVVEKCNLCAERLARGAELPSCVEVSGGAVLFGDLNGSSPRDLALKEVLATRFSVRRKPNLGTQPMVFYLV